MKKCVYVQQFFKKEKNRHIEFRCLNFDIDSEFRNIVNSSRGITRYIHDCQLSHGLS